MAEDTLSLYFELRPGEKADLEVVAAAALAWVEGIRAAVKAIDPDADVRIEMVDADESSLIFNTIARWLETHVEPQLDRIERGGEKLARTRKLAAALAVFLVITGPQTYDFYFGEADFTEDDRKLLRELAESSANDEGVKEARKKFYKTVEKDPSITGVGVKEHPGDKPIIVVPSNQFAEGGGLWSEPQQVVEGRTNYYDMDVILVKPALVHTPRSWTFRIEGLPEFDAVMRDEAVLHAMKDGLPETMREGIAMKVKIEVREVLVDGDWRLVRGGRSVIQVISPQVS